MKTIKLSSVHYEIAREKMKKRKIRTIEDYMEILIQDDYGRKNGRSWINHSRKLLKKVSFTIIKKHGKAQWSTNARTAEALKYMPTAN